MTLNINTMLESLNSTGLADTCITNQHHLDRTEAMNTFVSQLLVYWGGGRDGGQIAKI